MRIQKTAAKTSTALAKVKEPLLGFPGLIQEAEQLLEEEQDSARAAAWAELVRKLCVSANIPVSDNIQAFAEERVIRSNGTRYGGLAGLWLRPPCLLPLFLLRFIPT